jgi:hypothetical protein
MFSVLVGRPPTESFTKASQSDHELNKYLSSPSTDSTDVFLKQALSMAEETLAAWDAATGNSTSTSMGIRINKMYCENTIGFLKWLLSGPHDPGEVKEWQRAIRASIVKGGGLAEATKEVLAAIEGSVATNITS